jgi:hypothetical protein
VSRLVILISLVIAGVLGSAMASAQASDSPVPAPGTRIRVVTARPVTSVTGALVASSADTLVLRADKTGDTVSVPLSRVSRLDISRGTRTHKLRGAKIGFFGGMGVGAVTATLIESNARESNCVSFCDFNKTFAPIVGAFFGAVGGVIAGTAVGAWPTETWLPFSGPDGTAHVGIAPAGRAGVTLAASIRF